MPTAPSPSAQPSESNPVPSLQTYARAIASSTPRSTLSPPQPISLPLPTPALPPLPPAAYDPSNSLPPTRHNRHPPEPPYDSSYSSFGVIPDSAQLFTPLSMPPTRDKPPAVEGEGLRAPLSKPFIPAPSATRRHHSSHNDNDHHRLRLHRRRSGPLVSESPLSAPPTTFDPAASLTRSDSLLTKARRVFSLPASLKRSKNSNHYLLPNRNQSNYALDPSPSARISSLAYRRNNRPPSSVASTATEPSPHVISAHLSNRPRDSETSRYDCASEDASNPHSQPNLQHSSHSLLQTPDTQLRSRVKELELQLEQSRIRAVRQRKRIHELEEEIGVHKQAIPRLESILKSALVQFEAKEAALKHALAKMDQDKTALLNEKNEAMRLLAAFVGRGGSRSPPPSFSTISESGNDGAFYKDSRRALSMDTFRRAPPNQRSFFNGSDGEQGSGSLGSDRNGAD